MRRLVDDRRLLDTMKQQARISRCGLPIDHADELAEHLRNLIDGPSAPRPGRAEIRDVLFVSGIDGAPLRYRARLPAEALALHGVRSDVRHYRDPEVAALAERVDAIVLYRVPATDHVLALIQRLRGTRPWLPIIFDVDDLIFDPDLAAEIPALQILSGSERDLWLEGVSRYRTTMEACDFFIGSTSCALPACRGSDRAPIGLLRERCRHGAGAGG